MSDQDTQVVVDTAVRAAEPDALDPASPLYSLVVPPGSQHVIVDVQKWLEPYQDGHRRKRGQVALTTPASLIQYVKAHEEDGTEIYADWRQRKAVAVMNDHGSEAGWGDHRATLTLVAAPEWSRWTELDGKWMAQGDFAE